MVLGIDLMREFEMKTTKTFILFLLLTALFAVAACAQLDKSHENKKVEGSNTVSDDKIVETIGDLKLTLLDNDGKCQLLFGEETVDLDIPWKCNFHRLPDGKLRIFPRDFYESKNKKTPKEYRKTQIFIVEYSKTSENDPKECRTQLQAVKIFDGKITKSHKMDVAACPPFQWDDVNFIGVF